MSALRNPYLSNDTQNLLLRKNFNVVKSPQKSSLYPSYPSKSTNDYHQTTKINNHESSTSIGNKSSSVSLRNPFSSKTLGQRNQNFYNSYAITPSYSTQTHLPSNLRKQLPFPSYNRPQTIRGMSFSSNKMSKILYLSRRNLAASNVGITEASSLEKNINGPYRPHFVSPKNNNEWNTEKWKTELQKKERNNLKQFGPQALRYQTKLKQNFNSDYYSTSDLNSQFKQKNGKSHKNQQNITKAKNILSFEDDLEGPQRYQQKKRNNYYSENSLPAPQDPDTYCHPKNYANIKKFSQVHQQSSVQLHDQNSQSMVDEYQSVVHNNDDNENQFMSKYEDKNESKKRKGPLDLDAFDSGYSNELINESKQKDFNLNMYGSGTFGKPQKNSFRQEESSVFRAGQMVSKGLSSKNHYYKQSKLKSSVQNIPQRDYPQRIEYANKIYERIKLNEDRK